MDYENVDLAEAMVEVLKGKSRNEAALLGKGLALAEALAEARDRKKEIDEISKSIGEEIDNIQGELISLMVDAEMPGFVLKGNRFTLVVSKYPQAVADSKDMLYSELRERGMDDWFSVNSQTLRGRVNELIADNDDKLPSWMDGLVDIYEKTSIQIRKVKKS